eukprot:sb/3470420/
MNAEFLGTDAFNKFCIPYLKEIATNVINGLLDRHIEPVPMIIFAKGASHSISKLSYLGFDVVAIDWLVDPKVVRDFCHITVQGNLDPCALYSSKSELKEMVKTMVEDFGVRGYIANLGHGIYPDMDPDSVKTLVDTIENGHHFFWLFFPWSKLFENSESGQNQNWTSLLEVVEISSASILPFCRSKSTNTSLSFEYRIETILVFY